MRESESPLSRSTARGQLLSERRDALAPGNPLSRAPRRKPGTSTSARETFGPGFTASVIREARFGRREGISGGAVAPTGW